MTQHFVANRSPAVNTVRQALAQLPQADLPTDHFFANGMYARRVRRAAGVMVVGKVHRHEHFLMVLQGVLAVSSNEGSTVYQAGDIVVSKPGTQRITFALTDAIVATVHRTDKRVVEEIEEEIIEPSEGPVRYGAGNELLALTKEG